MLELNKKIIGVLSIILFLAVFVLALPGESILIVTPINNASTTSVQNILFNATFVNGTDITDPQSATFLLNISGIWQAIGSANCSAISCEANITNLTIPDGVYGVNVTISNSSSSISITNSSNLIFPFYVDITPPSVNIASPSLTSNYSQIISLSANVTDATIGVGSVIFNITNNVNATQSVTATAILQNSIYLNSFNTSYFSDGYYNISVVANDLLNNTNSTSKISRVLFDNTLPSVNYSCDDLTVNQNDEINCSCNATDSLAGLNVAFGNNGVSFTLHPSTSSVGNNKETTCTAEDTAGNRKISFIYYNVTSSSNSSSSSSSTSSTSSGAQSNSNLFLGNDSTQNNLTQIGLFNDGSINGNALSGNQGNDATPEQKVKSAKVLIITGIILIFILVVLLASKKMVRFIKNRKL